MMRARTDINHRQTRPGSALLLVLVIVMLLSFSCYTFVELMLVEYQASKSATSQVQLRRLADSGIEFVAAWIDQPNTTASQLDSDAVVSDFENRQLRFTIVRDQNELESPVPQFGVTNESAKLNLNALPLDDHKRIATRKRLLVLPEMTEEIADAILDWMDEDDEPSQYGAETSYYSSLQPRYAPRQNRFASLEELLLVRGVTREKLYGRDGSSGWSQFLTVYGSESNHLPDGTPKINVNGTDLELLFKQLAATFDEEAARFVVAWRIAGNASGVNEQTSELSDLTEEERGEVRKQQRRQTARERLQEQLGNHTKSVRQETSSHQSQQRSEGTASLAGIDISRKPAYTVRSLFDLVGSKVRINVNGQDTVLESPWSESATDLNDVMLTLDAKLTTTGGVVTMGRINVNEASATVLTTVPGINHSLAESIVRAQSAGNRDDLMRRHRTPGWLVSERLVDLEQLRLIAPYLTTGGDVVSGCAIGYASDGTAGYAVSFVVDGSHGAVRVAEVTNHGPIPWTQAELRTIHGLTRRTKS